MNAAAEQDHDDPDPDAAGRRIFEAALARARAFDEG